MLSDDPHVFQRTSYTQTYIYTHMHTHKNYIYLKVEVLETMATEGKQNQKCSSHNMRRNYKRGGMEQGQRSKRSLNSKNVWVE